MSAYRNPDPERMAVEAEERAKKAEEKASAMEKKYHRYREYFNNLWSPLKVTIAILAIIGLYGAGMGLSCSVCESHGVFSNGGCETTSVIWPLALPAHAVYSACGNFDTEIVKAQKVEKETQEELEKCDRSLKRTQQLLGEKVVKLQEE